jgi:hypothetical protein
METYVKMLNDTDEFRIEAREKTFTLTKKSLRKFMWSFRWKFGCFRLMPLFSCLEHIKTGENRLVLIEKEPPRGCGEIRWPPLKFSDLIRAKITRLN